MPIDMPAEKRIYSGNWKQMLATHPETEGGKEVSIFNAEYCLRRHREEAYLPNAGIVATEDNVRFTVLNRFTDTYEENLPEDQVEAAMIRLNVANSLWEQYDPLPICCQCPHRHF